MVHLYTIGHSTRSIDEFIEILLAYDITILVDVRSWPSSKRYPHFNQEILSKKLKEKGIKYEWLGKELGGYRKKGLEDDSPNKAWKSKSFRNYADHAMTEEFRHDIKKLLELAEKDRLVVMCAERFYWSCHRRIISDYLLVKSHTITHIIDKDNTREHELTIFAKLIDGNLGYPETP